MTAELLVKIGDGAGYSDGDVLCAFNRREVLRVWAETICHPRKAPRSGNGLIQANSVCRDWFDATHQYCFRRIGATELMRVETSGPRQRETVPALRSIIRRRKQNNNCVMFGEDGSEFWYGGRKDFSLATIQQVWIDIRNKTPRHESQPRHAFWPMGRLDIRSHLALRVDDMTDEEADDAMRPQRQLDENGDLMWILKQEGLASIELPGTTKPDERRWEPLYAAKRKHSVKWRDMLPDINATEAEVMDPNLAIGEEHADEELPMRYQSKTQPDQPKARVERKRRVTTRGS
ncbi:MAG: hypothetical protein HKN35_15965 [Woeseia sp.]|nr:hypothetical protein [Woeseia sp.]